MAALLSSNAVVTARQDVLMPPCAAPMRRTALHVRSSDGPRSGPQPNCDPSGQMAHHRSRMQRTAAAEPSQHQRVAGLTFRQATDADVPAISKAVLREAMNPLSLKAERFVVAEADGAVQGFGQLAPLAGGAEGGPMRRELRSLIVDPERRGGGIGQALVAELVQRADDAEIFLTTLGSTERFYTPHGFKKLRLREIPRSLIFEAIAGTAVARIVAQQPLIVMWRPPGGT